MTVPADINWHKCNTAVFWAEMAPSNHLLQIYENEEVIINSLLGYVSSGIESGECVIIIATDAHLKALHTRLSAKGFDIESLKNTNQYMPLNADDCLQQFMRRGWPEDRLFHHFVTDVMEKARGVNNRKVRAYGEMVAILWEQKQNSATMHLEKLWNRFTRTGDFSLFCAYPKNSLNKDSGSFKHICSEHTRIIAGDVDTGTEVFYTHA